MFLLNIITSFCLFHFSFHPVKSTVYAIMIIPVKLTMKSSVISVAQVWKLMFLFYQKYINLHTQVYLFTFLLPDIVVLLILDSEMKQSLQQLEREENLL